MHECVRMLVCDEGQRVSPSCVRACARVRVCMQCAVKKCAPSREAGWAILGSWPSKTNFVVMFDLFCARFASQGPSRLQHERAIHSAQPGQPACVGVAVLRPRIAQCNTHATLGRRPLITASHVWARALRHRRRRRRRRHHHRRTLHRRRCATRPSTAALTLSTASIPPMSPAQRSPPSAAHPRPAARSPSSALTSGVRASHPAPTRQHTAARTPSAASRPIHRASSARRRRTAPRATSAARSPTSASPSVPRVHLHEALPKSRTPRAARVAREKRTKSGDGHRTLEHPSVSIPTAAVIRRRVGHLRPPSVPPRARRGGAWSKLSKTNRSARLPH